MSVILGKCPHCGDDVIGGKYGAYCAKKCGFTAGKAFGRDLTENEVERMLAGEEVLLEGLISKKSGEEREYSMFVKADGIESYDFTKKDGKQTTGYRLKFKTRFPESETKEAEVIGKCPHCGADVVKGKYGAYCIKKCGFSLSWAYGRQLSDAEIKALLNGEEVLLKGCVHKAEGAEDKLYDMYAKADGYEEYTYTKKDGTEGAAYRMKFKTRFPGQDDDGGGENHSTVDKSGGEQEEPDDIDEADIEEPDIEEPDIEDDTTTGDSELPF